MIRHLIVDPTAHDDVTFTCRPIHFEFRKLVDTFHTPLFCFEFIILQLWFVPKSLISFHNKLVSSSNLTCCLLQVLLNQGCVLNKVQNCVTHNIKPILPEAIQICNCHRKRELVKWHHIRVEIVCNEQPFLKLFETLPLQNVNIET